MIKRAMWIGLTLSLLGFMSAAVVRADEYDKKTLLTFSQPVEVAGHVLPAGTYTFKLVDSVSNRHIVQISNADGSRIIATVMAIPDYRLTTTDQTVIKFREVPAGSPEVIRAWFYPGNSIGQEFVYPRRRATQLAKASKTVVPALAVDVTDAAALKTAPIVAITPDEREVPVTAAIQTTPVQSAANVAPVLASTSSVTGAAGVQQAAQNGQNARQLPQTASALPLVVLLGLGSIAVAFGLMAFGKPSAATAV